VKGVLFLESLFYLVANSIFRNKFVRKENVMTLQRTVNITKDRQVHLDLSVPQSVPVGKAEIKIIFTSYSKALSTRKKNTQSLSGMFADTNDTLDKFMIRKRAEKKLEYENG
jgi:hypothetical protein